MAIGNLAKKGLGAAGGVLMGGAGLIAGALVASTGAGKYIAGAAAIGAGAKKFGSIVGGSNTAAEKSLNEKSAPSEVEEGEVTILDKILQETNNLINVVQAQEIPESTKRELQLDKDVQHKKLIAAFKSLEGPKGAGDKDKKKLGWWEKLKGMFTSLSFWFRAGGLIVLWKVAKKFIKRLAIFAARMLLVFVSPAMLGVVAAVLIMTNWKKIKKSIKNTIKIMKEWANKVTNFLGMDDMFDMEEYTLDSFGGEGESVEETITPTEGESVEETITPTEAETGAEEITPAEPIIDTFGLEDDKEDIVEEIQDTLADDITTAPVPEPELEPGPEPESFVPLVTRRRLAEFNTDGSIEQEIYAKNKRELEANRLINDFIYDEVNGNRVIAQTKLKEYLAAGYGLDHTYLSDLNKTSFSGSGSYDAAINKGLDRKYGIGTEARQSALDAGIGGVTSYGPSPKTTPQTAPTTQTAPTAQTAPVTSKSTKNLPTGMFAAVNEPAKSTGNSFLDNLFAKDASMRYEKAFMKEKSNDPWLTEEPKVIPKLHTQTSIVDASVSSKNINSATKKINKQGSIVNKDSVAVFSAK